jgi:hypothetical protein
VRARRLGAWLPSTSINSRGEYNPCGSVPTFAGRNGCAIDGARNLLSTLKPEVFKKRVKIKTYFDTFLLLKPDAEVGDRQISIIGTKGAVDTGLYKFTFGDGKPNPIEARYSFTYKVVGEKCVILSHHSSALPKKKD